MAILFVDEIPSVVCGVPVCFLLVMLMEEVAGGIVAPCVRLALRRPHCQQHLWVVLGRIHSPGRLNFVFLLNLRMSFLC